MQEITITNFSKSPNCDSVNHSERDRRLVKPILICDEETVAMAEKITDRLLDDFEQCDRGKLERNIAGVLQTKKNAEAVMRQGELVNAQQNTEMVMRCKPFEIISDESVEIAQNIQSRTAKTTGGDSRMAQFAPYLSQAIEHYRQAGGSVEIFQPVVVDSGRAGSLNFNLTMNKIIVNIFDTEKGESMEYQYDVRVDVFAMDGRIHSFNARVESEKIKELTWLKKATMSMATLPRDKEEKNEFYSKVQHCIESTEVPVERIYQRAGWRNVPNLGYQYVYEGGIIGESTGLVHTIPGKFTLDVRSDHLGTAQTFYRAMEMSNICRNETASTMLLLYVHAAMLSTLYKMAGHPLNFVFGIIGVTNSRKTSMALEVAKIFDRDNMKADAEFATATACGIEKSLGIYKDAPVIVDDFKPGVAPAQQSDMDQKLDLLVRYCGDGVEKKRMLDFTSDGNKKFFPIEGGCVLTLEVVTGVMSSLSRMFITEIGMDDVVNERLSFYQEHRWILPTHIFDFLCWVKDRFTDIIEYIRRNVPEIRKKHSFIVARYADMYAMMMTIASLLSLYAREKRFWNEGNAAAYLEKVSGLLLNDLRLMEERLRQRDKGQIVLDAFSEAIRKSLIIPTMLIRDTDLKDCVLYEDDCFYYIRIRELNRIVADYCKRYKIQCTIINEDELIGLLERKGILDIQEVGGKRERSRKLPFQNVSKQRYLYMRKAQIEI